MTVRSAITAGAQTRPGAAPPADPHPCAAAHRAFERVYPDLRIRLTGRRRGAGWTTAAQLLASPVLRDRLLAAEARRTEQRHGTTPRPDVAAGFWLHRVAWPLGLFFTLPWLLDSRVPLPADGQLAHRHPARGGPAEVALRRGPLRFACLPGDPAAAHPDALVLPDRAALDQALRTAYAERLDPLLAALGPRLRRGARPLWGLATDELTEGLWFAAGLLGAEARAVAALDALLPGRTAPFTGGAGFRSTPTGPTRTRVSCCLFYTVRPSAPCAGCPRTRSHTGE